MTYMTHRDGYIQTNRIFVSLSAEEYARAMATGWSKMQSLMDVVGEKLGTEITGAEHYSAHQNFETQEVEVCLWSSWARPSRS